MLKKTNPLETFFATTPSHNDLISKAESSTRNCSRWARNSGVFSIQALQVGRQHQTRDTRERKGYPVSSTMGHHKYNKNRSRSNNVVNPVNVHAASMQWGIPSLFQQQYYPPPAFLMHRSLSDTMMHQQTNSNMCFRRNASSGEFSGTTVNPSPRKNPIERQREYFDRLRTWQPTSFGKYQEQMDDSNNPGFFFTIMSYNVLAQNLLQEHQYLYHEHDKKALSWEVRWTNLLHEINKHSPEIMCLQEVQSTHISNYYSSLENLGYASVYKRRTGLRLDGCAIYYKKDVLNLVEHIEVEFLQPSVTILNRDNVAIVAKFAPKDKPEAEFVVATTHLLYNPRRQDVRLAQTQVLLSEIERMAYKKQGDRNYIPMILTGDFNATPDSAVYELIRYGQVDYQHLTPRSLQRTNSLHRNGKVLLPPYLRINDYCQHADIANKRNSETSLTRDDEHKLMSLHHSARESTKRDLTDQPIPAGFCTGKLVHQFPMLSVYQHYVRNDMEGTTYQDEWLTVDYIFYSGVRQKKSVTEDKLRLLSRYSLPTTKQVQNVRMPNMALGSDHFSLLGKFKLEY